MKSTDECVEGINQLPSKEAATQVIPIDVIFDILVRVPVKSLVRFKCVSKAWLSLILSALFATTFNTRVLKNPSDRYSLLVIAKDKSTSQRHFLSAPYQSGSTTQLLTLPNIPSEKTEVDILNGLVLFHPQNGYLKHNFAFIINPNTHEVMKLLGKAAQPRFSYGNVHICYFFGFDPSTRGFKVLNTRIIGLRTPKKRKIECGLFDLSSCSWKRINPVFPFDIMGDDWLYWLRDNVCIDGVIYLLLHHSFLLAAFDLREESFSLIPFPQGAIPTDIVTNYDHEGRPGICFNYPYMINYNGLLAFICIEKIHHHKTVEIWILEDPKNQEWVKETIILPENCGGSGSQRPRNAIFTGEIMFTPKMISKECMQIPFYDMNKRCFRVIEISMPSWMASDDMEVSCFGGYVENIMRLRGMSEPLLEQI
ncbi:hypothetical protein LIER_40573 [Lithospermum erythrorhizon]|uniref:F-box domain-containing protein n=1 Tax=Lithospermum erythrorhizon TaxID=34254 RepID=A0AAV3QZL1_LITER